MEQQKQFSGTAAEEFAYAFKAQTGKIVEALKAKEERRNNLPPQLPAPLQEPRLRNVPSKSKMTGAEAVVAAGADTTRAQRKARRSLKSSRNMNLHFAKNLLLFNYLNPNWLHQIHFHPHFQSRRSA